MQRPAPSTTTSRGASTSWTGTSVSRLRRSVEAPQHATAADQVDAVDDEVLGQLGRGLAQAGHDRVDDRGDGLVDGAPDLLGRQHHRLGQAAHQLPAPDLGPELLGGRVGRADRDLDLLRRPLADGDAVLPADVGLDGGVDVEADPTRTAWRATTPPREMSADSEVPPPMSTTMLADRLVDGQSGADGRGHRLLDELALGGAGPAGGLGDGAALDVGDGRRHADDDPRPVEAGHPDPLRGAGGSCAG